MKLKDKKIKILKRKTVKDKDGFAKETWTPIHDGTLWAYFRWLSGKEFFAASAVQNTEECLFVINWRNDIDTDMKIEYGGKFYDITRIDVFEGYKEDLQIFAKLSKKGVKNSKLL
ncbi:MAG: phage head closure protein [Firmicutes bacterium]|nr:phage head closure protein [Bacillota bacterium]